jgi:hypothetical protein
MRLKEAMRQGGGQKRSLWDKLFGIPHRSGRQEKVLEHIIHHIEDGTTLREVFQEEYVRRNATSEEIRRILENPKLVQAAGEQLREYFSSESSILARRDDGREGFVSFPLSP